MSKGNHFFQRRGTPIQSGDSQPPNDILRGVLTSVVLAIVVIALAYISIELLFGVVTLATLFYGIASKVAE